jgi:hypothetical protein
MLLLARKFYFALYIFYYIAFSVSSHTIF